MSLAERFKTRRIELNLTQVEIASDAKVSQQAVEAIESGKTQKPRNILALAKALKCNAEWLLNGRNIIPLAEISTRQIPVLNYAQAGKLINSLHINNGEGKMEYIMADANTPEDCFALHIYGDAMHPEFKERDIVIIDPSLHPSPGEFVVAINNKNEATFMKYRALESETEPFELVPLNSDYPILRSTGLEIKIAGVMVEHRIFRRKR